MKDTNAPREPTRCPTHPGIILREDVIPSTGLSKAEIARRLKLSRQHLYDILNEKKPVTPNVAVRIGQLFGGGGAMWLRLQSAHDLWHVERDIDVSDIQPLQAA